MATLKQLHIFLAVAETLQMSEAARKLYVSQPTVSQTILELEREFGAVLFERSPRYLKLTAKGALLWEYAQQVADSYTLLDHGMKTYRLPGSFASAPPLPSVIHFCLGLLPP